MAMQLIKPEFLNGIDEDMLTQLIIKWQCNAISLTDDAASFAAGIFPFASMLEHDCDANAGFSIIATENGLKVQLHAVKTIKKNECVSICYIKKYAPAVDRQQKLEAVYGFKCTCSR